MIRNAPRTTAACLMFAVWASGVLVGCAEANRAAGACADGTYRCQARDLEVCSGGTWVFLQTCPGQQICLQSRCQLPPDPNNRCDTPNQTRCTTDGTAVELCNSLGSWTRSPCPTDWQCRVGTSGIAECIRPTTQPGVCPGPGTQICSADLRKVEVCLTGGTRATLRECAANEVCDPATLGCRPNGTGTCTAGEKQCSATNSRIVEVCTSQGSFAFYRECAEGTACDPALKDCGGSGGDPDGAETDAEPDGPPPESCSPTQPCTDSNQYCQLNSEGTAGTCRDYCGDPESPPCPVGYECDLLNTRECKRVPGFCARTRDCEPGQFCSKSPGQEWGRCRCLCTRPGCNCTVDGTKCVSDETSADYGKCVPINGSCQSCVNDFDCGNTGYCEKWVGQTSGCCTPKCRSQNDCPQGLACRQDGRCAGNAAPDCGGTCPQGNICDPVYSQCVLNCPACPPQFCCDANSAPRCYRCECTNPAICGFGLKQCCAGYSCSAIVYGVLGFCI